MRNLSALLVAASIGLAGCAEERMASAVAALDGQPVSTAFARFGPPNEERTVQAKRIYTWRVDELGPLGTRFTIAIEYKCLVQVTSDSDNIVRHEEWTGNPWGCNKLLAHRG